ncbi:helix-turn-helix domain-containing protein [Hymenobacter taeanensis]|uniref:Helix-turn-helix domain-containing protein n=1 Tax=Hymenobacter taeanensis TaxID=2735321 RepID=A0A6M6BFP0_9BACT|nr:MULTISPECIES: helix-turn-helix domain-containing protein [Hymenobacter]QJX46772.1 helix-turn-helix domain-containing protein [Hymenobacter taeanensis]UOQ80641.1 helix-turn-helix domain-containing protein [Hymenobacter sp. 5414T-23]
MFSAARISAIRKSKGLSQEVLAEQSGVSLRTIQRVEQGDTVPRGFTLQALATALEVPLEAFRLEPEVPLATAAEVVPAPASMPAAALPHPDPQFLQLLNLSALSFLVFPLLNLVVPWVLWRKHRHDVEDVAEVGRRVLGFQILWQVLCFLSYGLAAVAQLWAHLYHLTFPNLFVWVFLSSYLLNLVMVCYNGWKLRQGDLNIYPFRL